MGGVGFSVATVFACAALRLVYSQQPEQAHLAMTGKPGELSLDFMSHRANCSIGWGVQLSTSPDFTGASYIPAYACDDFTKEEPALTLAVRVLLTPLLPGTTYYYVCGSEALGDPWSQVYTFTYDTGSQRAGGPVYAVLADFGYYNAESLMKLTAEAYEGRFDVLLHAGDFAYDFDAEGGHVGDGYMRQLTPIISSRPYNGIPGNHEVGSNFTHYRTRFASIAENAGARSRSNTNMFYSVVDGLTHFIFWDSEAFWAQPVDSQTAMLNWLRADLAAANANRAAVPWVVALSHKTWWMDPTIQCPSGAGCVVWQVLEEGGVDLHFAGHIHYYARDLPEYPNAANGTGAVDAAAASPNLGNATNPVAVYTNPRFMTMIITAAPGDQEVNRRRLHDGPAVGAPQHSVVSTNNYGYGYLTVINSTHLHWRFETAVPHVNTTAKAFTDDLTLIVETHGPRANLPPV